MTAYATKNNFSVQSKDEEDLIRKHMPLVKKMAKRIAAKAPPSIITEDLFSAGSLGLVDSVIRNNGSEGAQFACYVRMRIKGAIYDEMRASDWLPRRNRKNSETEPQSGPPRPVAVIRFDDLPPGKESNPHNKEPRSNPFEMLNTKRSYEKLEQALNSVPTRDRLILHLHYFRGMQVREIGRLLGISDARISQIHHKALERIKPMIENLDAA
ncbi:MAG: sigma-70 family RNA polymerase sigma factor [Deltaproteobacteria bacterium]|nr:sigma-70 family RNA polymerase sigma factor [Deltaproteobacteria bacterium]